MNLHAFLAILALVGAPEAPKAAAPVAVAAPPAKPGIELRPTEVDAVGWQFDALLKYPESERPYLMFAHLPWYSDAEWHGVMDVAVNLACSQTPILCKGDIHAGGYLMAWNLQRLCPEPVALARLLATRDELAVRDSVFHIPQSNFVEITENIQVPTGRTVAGKPEMKAQARTRKISRPAAFLAPHLQAAIAKHATDATKSQRIDVLVTQMTSSTGAIYPAEFLLEQLLTSARGKYPEFRQMDFKTSPFTPLQTLLQKRGFFLEASKNLSGAKGAITIASDITGTNRFTLAVNGLSSDSRAIITFDFKESRNRADERFIRNLVEPDLVFDASEVFIPMTNGLIEYVLANGKGDLQRVAPPDVVADDTKPKGHPKELEMGMSCILCHSPDDGYKPIKNDVELLVGSDSDFFGDTFTHTLRSGRVINRAEAVAIVAGRFGQRMDEPDGILGRARRDLIRSVNQLTNYPVEAGGQSPVQQLGKKTQEIYHGYRYRLYDARRICRDLGVDIPAELDPDDKNRLAIETLKQLVPKRPRGEQTDVMVDLARNGAKITRDDMDAIRPELARQAIVGRESFAKPTPVASSN